MKSHIVITILSPVELPPLVDTTFNSASLHVCCSTITGKKT